MNARLPLRARKKAKVREALIATSFRLFSRKGYTETTLEEICEQCDVTVQTLLRYFGSKDDLLFANHPMLLDKVGKGLARASVRKSSIDYWLKFLHSGAVRVREDKEIAQSYRIVAGAPALLARFFAIGRQYEMLLEDALSREAGAKPGEDLHATLLAHLIVTVPIQEALRLVSAGKTDAVVERCDEVAQYALENFKRPPRKVQTGRRAGRKAGRGTARVSR